MTEVQVTQVDDQDPIENNKNPPDYRLARRLSVKRMNSQMSAKSNDEVWACLNFYSHKLEKLLNFR